MKVLILGAKGNLGQVFVGLYHDHEVFAWDRSDLDVTDEEMVMNKISELQPGLVINCAAYNAVDNAEDDRITAESVNGYAPGYIAKAADAVGATMVHYSTGQVFDGAKPQGYNEDDLPEPLNVYGKSKQMGEIEAQANTERLYIIRTCWLYGKPTGGKKSFTDIVLDLAQSGSVKGVGDEFGNPTYVVDLAQATRALVEENKPFGIYHLVNTGIASRYDWAKEVLAIKGISADLILASASDFPRKAARPKYEVLNNTKFIELRPWTEALREYLS